MKDNINAIFLRSFMVDIHIHLDVLQELFEAISVTAEGFRLSSFVLFMG
jgi:hypothetical protein